MLTLLEELEDIHILDKPMETNMAEIGDKPDWLNLPDLAFNEIMMRVNLRTCMQVCSSWKDRITTNILENPTKKNIIRARMERAMGVSSIGGYIELCPNRIQDDKFPCSEDICNTKWLGKKRFIMDEKNICFQYLEVFSTRGLTRSSFIFLQPGSEG